MSSISVLGADLWNVIFRPNGANVSILTDLSYVRFGQAVPFWDGLPFFCPRGRFISI